MWVFYTMSSPPTRIVFNYEVSRSSHEQPGCFLAHKPGPEERNIENRGRGCRRRPKRREISKSVLLLVGGFRSSCSKPWVTETAVTLLSKCSIGRGNPPDLTREDPCHLYSTLSQTQFANSIRNVPPVGFNSFLGKSCRHPIARYR